MIRDQKTSQQARARANYHRNRDRYLKANKAYREKNKEKIAEYKRKHRERNRDKLSKKRKIWLQENREYWQKYYRSYKQSSYSRFLTVGLRGLRQKDVKNGQEFDLDIEFLMDLLVRQNYRCALSGVKLNHLYGHLNSVSIDRIDSSKGHTKDNVQLVCQFVNLGKRNMSDNDVRAHYLEVEMNIVRLLRKNGLLNYNKETMPEGKL